MKRLLLCSFALLLLGGCSKDIDLKEFENKSPEEILKIGKTEMANENFSDAVQVFEELEKLHPYSKLVAESQICTGDSNYKLKKYDEATSAFEIFVKTHPTHEKVPYALYMLGTINYEQMPIVSRDQDVTAKSLAYFVELVRRYPKSKYVKESEEKIKSLKQQLAGREMYVARYYQTRKNYAAAIGRFNTVVFAYSDTNQTPEALLRLIECYMAMGLPNEAQSVFKVLSTKYPKETWTQHAKALLNQK